MRFGSSKAPSVASLLRAAIMHAMAMRAPTETAAVLRVSHVCVVFLSFVSGLTRRISRRMCLLRDAGASVWCGMQTFRAASNRRSIGSGSGFMMLFKPEDSGGYCSALDLEIPKAFSSERSLLLARNARTLISVPFHPVMAEISAIDFSSMCRSWMTMRSSGERCSRSLFSSGMTSESLLSA